MAMADKKQPRKWTVADVRNIYAEVGEGVMPDAEDAQRYADGLNKMEEENPGSTDTNGFSSLKDALRHATTKAGHAISRGAAEVTEHFLAPLREQLQRRSPRLA